jgi:hypothetical protein
MVANSSDEALTFPKATALGIAEEVFESLVDQINQIDESIGAEKTKRDEAVKKALYRKLLAGKLSHLRKEGRLLSRLFYGMHRRKT